MKTISLWLTIFTLTVGWARGQDSGTQQQINKLGGQIQDIQAALELQDKRLTALEKQISDLSDKVNTPVVNNAASADDLKALATQVQEIDQKRQADRALILKQLENLGKGIVGSSRRTPPPAAVDDTTPTAPATPQKGYEHQVEAGETISAIAKAYRAQGVKVTTDDILKANPKLDPTKLYVGQKVFVPDPNAK